MTRRTDDIYHNDFTNDDSYDDSFIRDKAEEIWFKYFGEELRNNPDEYGIDKLFLKDPTRGVEVEHGGWDDADYWNHLYSRKCKVISYPTVNMQYRKLKYWFDDEFEKGEKNIENHRDTIFCRFNIKCDQFILVRPEAILQGRFTIKKLYCVNTKKWEDFCCFKRQYAETYNIIDNKLIKS